MGTILRSRETMTIVEVRLSRTADSQNVTNATILGGGSGVSDVGWGSNAEYNVKRSHRK